MVQQTSQPGQTKGCRERRHCIERTQIGIGEAKGSFNLRDVQGNQKGLTVATEKGQRQAKGNQAGAAQQQAFKGYFQAGYL